MKHLKLEELKVGNYVLHNFYRIKLDGALFAQKKYLKSLSLINKLLHL